jgi:hypothetical protein
MPAGQYSPRTFPGGPKSNTVVFTEERSKFVKPSDINMKEYLSGGSRIVSFLSTADDIAKSGWTTIETG